MNLTKAYLYFVLHSLKLIGKSVHIMNCSDKIIFFRCGIELASLKNCLVVTMYSIVKEPNKMLHVCAEQKNDVSDEVSIALLAS